MQYETVIGLEVHVQLLTASKIFCGCENSFSHDPNTHVCPVCLGHPGTLPVLNREVLEKGMRAALALGCTVAPLTKFDRKHYYYPDLPKNYQISQYDLPLAEHGAVEIPGPDGPKRVGITRLHLEEDAGKLVHGAGGSVVDLNRTGTPLAEIVTEPDLRSPEDARTFLQLLRRTMRYLGVSDCEMQEGSLRCDANVSVRPVGTAELGVKNEIKNMNSFRGVEHALGLVRDDLVVMLEADEPIRQVTWGYRIDDGAIFQMRTKEYANDYRYFPEPDLPPVRIDADWIERVRADLCELPADRERRMADAYGLGPEDAEVLASERELADYFEGVARASGAPKEAANWVANDVLRELNDRGLAPDAFPVAPEMLAELIALLAEGTINRPTARSIFGRLIEAGGGSPRALVEAEGLGQVSDRSELRRLLEEAVSANPKAAEDIRGGKLKSAGFFVGQIMRALKGQGDPAAIAEVIGEHFGIDPAALAKKKKK